MATRAPVSAESGIDSADRVSDFAMSSDEPADPDRVRRPVQGGAGE
jgi:hypothetical protein